MARRRKQGRTGRRRRRGRSPRLARVLIGLLVGSVLAAVAAIGWLLLVYPKERGPGTGRVVRVHIDPGAGVDEVARALAEGGAVSRPRLFGIYARLLGADERLRQGTVVLTDDLSPGQIVPHVAEGFGPAWVRIAVPEGFTRFDIAERLDTWDVCDAEEFLRVTGSQQVAVRLGIDEARTLEGYLFPATYELRKGSPSEDVAREMVETWRRRVLPIVEDHAAGLAELERGLGWDLHEVIILASIVEKEAAVPEERPVIAGVFLNRLRDPAFTPKRLQADPTVAYGCLAMPEAPSCAEFTGRITGTMLRGEANPYNTYRREGLPEGPISNPGADSIRAVLDPAEHDYLYFVARGRGRHHFSNDLEEHVRAVERYRGGATQR